MKIKLIINPASGGKKAEKLIPAINEILRRSRLDFDIGITRNPGEATYLAREASKNNFQIIVAAGGDGTVNEVVNGIIGSNSLLGVIPLGLGNDFAKGIGIPSKLKEACLVFSDGITRDIDVGRVNNRYFVNGLGIGFDAWVAWESQRIRKFLPSKWIYLFAAIKIMFKYQPIPVKIDFAKTSLEKRVLLIAVGNGKSCGGGFLLTPEAEFDDGLIDACIIDGIDRAKLIIHLPKALKGTHTRLPYVTAFKTNRLTINSPNLLLAHVDGEILQDYKFQIEILPKRLKVITPKQR